MTAPRVTIGMPVYQGEQFVDDAIRSVREQTFDDFELIISDNGSTDATEEICRRHAAEDARVTYQRSAVNRGASWNFSRLVELASGTYFKWASHDDILGPTFIEVCVAVLDDDPGVVLCHPRAATIDLVGEHVKTWPPNTNAIKGTAPQRFADILFREGPCFPVFGLMRREVLNRTALLGPYNGHDRPLLAEMALHGRYAFIDDVLFLNREHPSRSIRAFKGPRERIAWFDPAQEGHVVYNRPRLVLEFHRAIRRSSIPATQAVRAHGVVLAWALKHTRGLVRDILGGFRAHLYRWRDRAVKGRRPISDSGAD